jgi:endonuclease YncB( thermonuclease family)
MWLGPQVEVLSREVVVSPTAWDWPNSSVVRVIDGDSLVAVVTRDLGFNGKATFSQHLRLNRINAAPISTDHGKAARDAVVAWTSGYVHITTVGPYKYGDEWMAEIVLADGRNLSDALVAGGLAVYWDGSGPRPGDA